MTIERAAATSSFTLDNTGTPTLIDGLTLTPASNDYFLFATCETENAQPSGAEDNIFSVWVGGVQIDHTERNVQEETSLELDRITVALNARVSPNGSEDVEIRFATSSGSTPQTAFRREMDLFPEPSAGTSYEDTDEVDDTNTSSTWVTLDGMSRTPVAGTYFLLWTSDAETTSDDLVAFRVEVGGTAVAHTHREFSNENSLPNTTRPVMIACEVNPNGSEVVEIAWQNVDANGTVTCHKRAMQLIAVASGDIVQATSVADDARTVTGEILIDDMTITDPGAADWMMAYSSWTDIPSIFSEIETTYSIRTAGVKVPDSDRRNDHEGSTDFMPLPVLAGALVTVVGATDDLEMYWDNTSEDEFVEKSRTFVGIRESVVDVTADGAPEIFLPTAAGTAVISRSATGAPSIFLPTTDGAAEIIKKAAGTPAIALVTAAGSAHPCSEILPPDAIVLLVGLSGDVTDIDEPVNSPDGNWLLLA